MELEKIIRRDLNRVLLKYGVHPEQVGRMTDLALEQAAFWTAFEMARARLEDGRISWPGTNFS